MNRKHVKYALIISVLFLLFGCVSADNVIDDNEQVTDTTEPVAIVVSDEIVEDDQTEDTDPVIDQANEQTEEMDDSNTEEKIPEGSGQKPRGSGSNGKDDDHDDEDGGCVLTKVWVVDEPAETIQRYVVDQEEQGHSEQIWHDPVTHLRKSEEIQL